MTTEKDINDACNILIKNDDVSIKTVKYIMVTCLKQLDKDEFHRKCNVVREHHDWKSKSGLVYHWKYGTRNYTEAYDLIMKEKE